MDELAREMYKEQILESYNHPSNFGKLEHSTNTCRAHNPLCGDDITMQLIVNDNKIKDIKFLGKGCAISMASVSLLTDKVKNKSIEEIKNMNTPWSSKRGGTWDPRQARSLKPSKSGESWIQTKQWRKNSTTPSWINGAGGTPGSRWTRATARPGSICAAG